MDGKISLKVYLKISKVFDDSSACRETLLD